MTIIESKPAPLSIENILAKVILSPSDKKAIASAQSKIADVMALIVATEPDRPGNKNVSQLHIESDAIEQAFLANPNRNNAEALHDALVRLRDAGVSFTRIDGVCHSVMNAASLSLQSVAMNALDAALKNLDESAASTRKALIETANAFSDDGELAIFDSRLAVTKSNLEGERTEARSNPLQWLASRGLA